jgi:hypothetical protein
VPDLVPPPHALVALRRVWRRVVAARWRLGLLVVLLLAAAAPSALLAYGTARARACVASYEAPRGPDLPDCRREISWFITPSRIPWTATPARYRAEELGVRVAVAAYDDASVGRPDEGAQASAAAGLVAAEKVIHAGSQRVSIEELGRAVGSPDAGRSAMLAGDRRTLIEGYYGWDHWAIQLRAIEAALLDGGLPRAHTIALRYADFHPQDEDLRTAVAAILCLGGEGDRGMQMLAAAAADRARERHESWARNWGDVRVLLVACAAKAGTAAPPPPEPTGAGSGDRIDARAALRLRLLSEGGAGEAGARVGAALDVIQMLKAGPLGPGGRVRVLAALLASGHPVGEILAAELAVPHTDDGEPPLLAAPHAITAVDWLDEPRGRGPAPWPRALREAAETLRQMAVSPDLTSDQRRVLQTAASATALDAARALALAGDAPGAVAVLDRAGDRPATALALARSSAWYVAGDPARALAEMADDPQGPEAAPTAVVAAWWLQKAELLASAGRRDDAARAAEKAVDAAETADDRALRARARWTRVAFSPFSQAAAPAGITPPRTWPWSGEAGTPASWLAPEAEGSAAPRSLEFWTGARLAPSPVRRALRYAAFNEHRGDAPRAPSAYLALGAGLLAPDEGSVEVWLDAFSATWSRRLTLRAYAWARAEAARFRGDLAAAARWDERLRTLTKLASAPGNAELCAGLGI